MARTKTRSRKGSLEESGLSEEQLEEILYLLKLCRYFDERMEALYRQGRLPGAIYSGRGQEGTHVGAAAALRADDSLFCTHRDLSAQLTKGLDLNRVMAQFWGRIDGYTVAAGAALAYKRRGEDRIALAICGDGSTSNGRWHESLNVSAIHRLPVVWVVNNNQWAYSTPNSMEFPT